jgi:hypothetical protein
MDQLQRLKQVRSVAAVVGFDQEKCAKQILLRCHRWVEEKLKRPLLGTAGAATVSLLSVARSLVR